MKDWIERFFKKILKEKQEGSSQLKKKAKNFVKIFFVVLVAFQVKVHATFLYLTFQHDPGH